jgi:hypothetical protein
MAFSTSSCEGVNCHTDLYSFSMVKSVDAMACRKSVQGISPAWSARVGVWKRVLKTFKARLLTVKVGWTSWGGMAAGVSIAALGSRGFAEPLALGLTLRCCFFPRGSGSVCLRFENC